MHKIIVFDLDGTLINSDEAIFLSWKEMFENFYNDEFSSIALNTFSGPPISVTHKKYFSNYDFSFIKNEYLTRTTKYYKDHIFLFDNEINVLQNLIKKGYILTIFTNKSKEKLHLCLKMFGMERLFDFIVSGDDIRESKPNPEGLRLIKDHYNCVKDDLFFIGDTLYDYEAARQFDIDFAFLTILQRDILKDSKTLQFKNYEEIDNFFVEI